MSRTSNDLTLCQRIADVLDIANPQDKAQQTRQLVAQYRSGLIQNAPPLNGSTLSPKDRPAREDLPVLVPPSQVKKRSITRGTKGRFALLHAIAHIELNAINLSLDIALRYGCVLGSDQANPLFPEAFLLDWLGVADDEAKHFLLLDERLTDLEGRYGDLPAHDGLWESAIATKDDPLARLAVVPMVLEARGLDVTPLMIEKFAAVEDQKSIAALEIIYRDEIGHVDVGRRWFEELCSRDNLPFEDTWQELVKKYFRGAVKRPFNQPARSQAGMEPSYYEPLADWYEGLL